jgi:hypothetical protein
VTVMVIEIDNDDSIVTKARVIKDKERHIEFFNLMIRIFING